MEINFVKPALPGSGTIVLLIVEGRGLGPLGQTVDKAAGGQLARAMATADFTGKHDESLTIQAPAWFDRVLLVGLGKLDAVKPGAIEALGGGIYSQLSGAKAASISRPRSPKARFCAPIASTSTARWKSPARSRF
jgi:leucyl aminopeptidase